MHERQHLMVSVYVASDSWWTAWRQQKSTSGGSKKEASIHSHHYIYSSSIPQTYEELASWSVSPSWLPADMLESSRPLSEETGDEGDDASGIEPLKEACLCDWLLKACALIGLRGWGDSGTLRCLRLLSANFFRRLRTVSRKLTHSARSPWSCKKSSIPEKIFEW